MTGTEQAALIGVLIPALLAVLKIFVPRIPKVAIPILAPVLGVLAELAAHYANQPGLPVSGAVLGLAGIGLRELVDQLRRRNLDPVSLVLLLALVLPGAYGCGAKMPRALSDIIAPFKEDKVKSALYTAKQEMLAISRLIIVEDIAKGGGCETPTCQTWAQVYSIYALAHNVAADAYVADKNDPSIGDMARAALSRAVDAVDTIMLVDKDVSRRTTYMRSRAALALLLQTLGPIEGSLNGYEPPHDQPAPQFTLAAQEIG